MPQRIGSSRTSSNPLPWSISPDGGALLIVDSTSMTDITLAVLDIGKDESAKRLLDAGGYVLEPSLAPNGQWLAYYDGDPVSGKFEVNLRPYPDVRQQRRSVGPGLHPVFSGDGSEIFMFDGEGLSAASVQYSPLRVSAPRKLFRGEYQYGVGGRDGSFGRAWDVDSRNDRFLMITLPPGGASESRTPPARFSVVQNWFDELERRAPKH